MTLWHVGAHWAWKFGVRSGGSAGGRPASGSGDKTVRIWDVDTGGCVQVLTGHGDWVYEVAALPDGRLASGSGDKPAQVWD